MKKIFILSFVVLASAISLSSCTKDYTCTCTDSNGTTSTTSSVTIHDTAMKAKKSCEASNKSNTTTGYTTVCQVQ
jgi:hypothetical protein